MTDVYGTVYRKALLPAWENVVRRRPTLDLHAGLLRSQWFSLDELHALQLRDLRRLLGHAYAHVPHYRASFDRVGFSPGDLRELSDLGKLPVLTRDLAQASAAERRSRQAPLAEIEKSTSGSTGQPLVFGYDQGSEHWRQAVKLRGYGWAGWKPGDRTLYLWGSLDSLYHKSWQKHAKVAVDRFLRREIYIDCNARSEADLARMAARVREFAPEVLVCFAQAGAELARWINQNRARRWDDIAVITGAERLFPADRAEIERAFGPRVFETYGSREVMLIGAECEAHSGLHASMENLIVEVLVPEGGGYRSAEPGEVGEIAITDLHNYGMPFIRYLCGDLASLAPAGRCACGRALTRIQSLEGRTNDTLRDDRGRAVDSLFFNVLFSVLGGKVKRFQAVQKKSSEVVLSVVPGEQFDESVALSVRDNCRKFFGALPVSVQVVDEIPLGENGKRRVVVVEH